MIRIDRRRFLAMTGASLAAGLTGAKLSLAANPPGIALHGLSAFGDLKYPADFQRFDYSNTDAPSGGTFNFQPGTWFFNQSMQTFNTLNSFVRKGDAPPRMELCFDALMTSAIDEPDAIYCHLAETVTLSDDGNTMRFVLRDSARWHDGTPITADDVVFSYRILKDKGIPDLSLMLDVLSNIAATGPNQVTLTFNGKQSAQDVLGIVSVVPILSKTWYETHEFDASTLTAPLGSVRYKVGRFDQGRFIEYDRVEDYWARDLPTATGLGHFAKLRFEFYSERQTAFEAFKKGEIHYREEFSSKSWETEYDFPALREGKVVKHLFDGENRPRMQAWAFNRRRAQFSDRRVRLALALCFDFEWTNKAIFYNAYERSQSLFENSDYKTQGTPDAAEQALIAELGKDHDLPEGLSGPAFALATTDGSGRDRKRLREAAGLLREAGWQADNNGVLKNATGQTLDVEMLINWSGFERVYNPYIETLKSLGINASLRLVDSAQYQERIAGFDFDIAGLALAYSPTPSASSLKPVFSSQSANAEGSRNWPGTKDPLLDALINKVGQAKSREEHRTAMRVLDRLLRLQLDWFPTYNGANHRVAYWDMFGFDEPKPDYHWPVELLWWFDEEKAKAIGKA